MRGILMAAMLALGVASGVQTSFAADPTRRASVANEVRAKREKLQELVKDASRQASNAWAEAKTEIFRLIAESERALSRVPK